MNKKIRLTVAAICAAAAVMAPISSAPVYSTLSSVSMTASAASTVLSGSRNFEFYYENAEQSYTLYFNVLDSSAKTASVIGCLTNNANTNVTVPDTATFRGVEYRITEIGATAFKNQSNMSQITITKNVTAIRNSGFSACRNLTAVYCNPITPGCCDYALEEIGNTAFMNCEKLNVTSFTNFVKRIGDRAFAGCTSMNYLYLSSLEYMGQRAFAECSSLNLVDLSEATITAIPDRAFEYSSSDRNTECQIKLPPTVQTIGYRSFYNVNGIRLINLSHVISIAESAFEDCHSLKTVFTGDNLYSIGARAFFGCDPMTYFVCKNDNVWIGTEALGYDDIRNYQGKKQNFTLWGSSDSSNVNRYAANHGFTYKKTSDAAAQASERYVDYEWRLANIGTHWGDNYKYYFNNDHLPYANPAHTGKSFNGICAGMATVSALTSNGYLSVSDYAPGYSKIKDIYYGSAPYYIPSKVKSYVTTVWSNSVQNYNYDYTAAGTIGEEMMLYAEYITYGADTAVLTTTKHGMVCFGMEYKKDASDKNASYWNGWDARIMVYDVNRSFTNGKAHSVNDYIYVNHSNGTWTTSLNPIYGNGQSINGFSLVHDPNKMISTTYSCHLTAPDFFNAIRVQQ